VLERFFGPRGALIAAASLGLWVTAPAILGARVFRRKDF
jgi:hypothetical protein